MLDDIAARVQADFARARSWAFLNDIFGFLSGRPKRLLSYDQVKQKLHIGGPIYRGLRTVEIARIVGSVNRYADFDRAFLPTHSRIANRWQNVDRRFTKTSTCRQSFCTRWATSILSSTGTIACPSRGSKAGVYRGGGPRVPCQGSCGPRPAPGGPGDSRRSRGILGTDGLGPSATGCRRGGDGPDGYSRILEHIAVHRYFMVWSSDATSRTMRPSSTGTRPCISPSCV